MKPWQTMTLFTISMAAATAVAGWALPDAKILFFVVGVIIVAVVGSEILGEDNEA